MTTHTPGPWRVGFPDGVSCFWSDQNKGYVAICANSQLFAFGSAVAMVAGDDNARLIAASPEMLEHGQFLLDRIDELDFADMPEEFMRDWIGHVEPALSRFRAILAKARGTT